MANGKRRSSPLRSIYGVALAVWGDIMAVGLKNEWEGKENVCLFMDQIAETKGLGG